MRDRIVVGVDGSPGAQAALAWAMRLGEALGAEVVAVHAVGLLETAHPAGQPAGAWRAGLRDLTDHRWCARLVDAGLAHRIEVVDGPAVDVLLDAAQREHASLVVVGARGVGRRPELALGSTSLRLLQAARVRTLVVPDAVVSETEVDRPRRRILVGVDRSPASLAALAVAVDLAPVLGASLTVVEAFEFEPPFPLAMPAGGTSRDDRSARLPTAAVIEDLVPRIRSAPRQRRPQRRRPRPPPHPGRPRGRRVRAARERGRPPHPDPLRRRPQPPAGNGRPVTFAPFRGRGP